MDKQFLMYQIGFGIGDDDSLRRLDWLAHGESFDSLPGFDDVR